MSRGHRLIVLEYLVLLVLLQTHHLLHLIALEYSVLLVLELLAYFGQCHISSSLHEYLGP
jgi:hypothetical protein